MRKKPFFKTLRERATINQLFVNDQINVTGGYDNSGNIVAGKIRDWSLKETSLTRRNVGSENLKDDAISNLGLISNGVITEDKLQAGTLTNSSISDTASIGYSKLNLTNSISGNDLAANISINTTGDVTGNNLNANGIVTSNGAGNNYFVGNVGIGTSTPNYKLDVNGNIGIAASGYLNFGSTNGDSGYGLKDNSGTLQYKNSGGSWTSFANGQPSSLV